MSGQHAVFAPSSAHRIATCPASLLRTKDLPDRPSFEAVEGTVAHALHALVLTHGVDPATYVGRRADYILLPNELTPDEWALLDGWTVPAEMATYVRDSADWCLEMRGYKFVEQRLSVSRWTPIPDQFGTSDFVALDLDAGALDICDLKYGKGVQVFAERNPQLVMYALGALDEFECMGAIGQVRIHVSQPRLDHRDTWETTPAELREIGEWLRDRFTLALKPDAPFNPEKHACQFCKLKPTCPGLYDRTLSLANGWFDDLTCEIAKPDIDRTWPLSMPDPRALNSEYLSRVLEEADMIEGFLEAVRAHATHLLLHSQDVPGWKIVEGRSNRQWRDAEAAKAWLEKHAVDPHKPAQIISPAEAEKALPKALRTELAPLVVKPTGKPTLAPVSDRRPAFTPATADGMFEVVPATDDT